MAMLNNQRVTGNHTWWGTPSIASVQLFPTCPVRVVRFYVSCLLLPPASSSSSSPPRPPRPPCHPCRPCRPRRPRRPRPTATRDPQVFSVGPQPRPSTPSVPCRTSTTTIHTQCSLPDLNHDHPRPVFPAGPQPRPSTPSVPCRTSTGRGWSWLRSGREHWAWMVVVEVRQGTCRKIWDKECAEES